MIQDAAVLGKTFTPPRSVRSPGSGGTSSSRCSPGSCARSCWALQADPRSPEHGQYGFLQDLIRQVAYDTLAKRDRRAKHLAAAEHLGRSLAEDEVAEVVASHLVEAYQLDPDAEDAAELRERAGHALLVGAERAAALGAASEAARFFEQAAGLAPSPEQSAALARAGEMLLRSASWTVLEGVRSRVRPPARGRRSARGGPSRGLARLRGDDNWTCG